MKGGAAGGGYAQVAPMDAINLHFTGDFHAITTANNLLASMVDNHMYWGNALGIDQRRIVWRRALDLNDRALRETVVGLGGAGNGFPREEGFDITVASETMAAFCLAADLADLEARLGRMIVGYRRDRQPVTAADLKAAGAMTALLKDALRPNLVQTLEGSPALVHGGPFANIAHGCNSVVATRAALKLGDYVVTEAGFGADLGAEKFFDIKCRMAGLKPAAAVIVATVRALKMHGGVAKDALGAESLPALKAGFANLARHIANLRKFGVPVVVAVNRFASDTDAELDFVRSAAAAEFGVKAIVCDHWARGGAGCEDLAHAVAGARRRRDRRLPAALSRRHEPVGKDAHDRARNLRRRRRRGRRIRARAVSRPRGRRLGSLPVCVAKTQYSFSDNPALLGAPSGHTPTVREVRLRAGAGFVVVLMGDIRTMPGPAAQPRGGAHSRGRRRNPRPLLTASDAQRGAGASARISFSSLSVRQSAGGIFALIISALRLASLARCAPGMTLTTAGWPSGKRSAASGSLTLNALQICWIRRTRSFTASGGGPYS